MEIFTDNLFETLKSRLKGEYILRENLFDLWEISGENVIFVCF